jgi:membrane associated rhomboid family serine protease
MMERYAYCNLLVIAFTCWFSFLGFRDAGFESDYLFWPEAILARRQFYRLITSGFLHLNVPHLAMNMLSLYFFGPLIERICGPVQFLLIYLGAMVGGNLLALYVHRSHDYRALGASGGVAGIILAYIFLFPGGSIRMYFLPIGIPSWLYAVAFLLASFYGMQRRLTNVGHDAHLGGALVGLFTATALHPQVIRYSPRLFVAISVGTALLFIYLARNPLFLPLEGFNFAKSSPRPPRQGWRASLQRLFHFTRRKGPAAPLTFNRPDRRVDAILQKISAHGIDSLTEEERKLMDEVSDKYRRRAARDKPRSGFPF